MSRILLVLPNEMNSDHITIHSLAAKSAHVVKQKNMWNIHGMAFEQIIFVGECDKDTREKFLNYLRKEDEC